ncbi:PH domain-containing protein [Streptomyces sp. NPDC001941]|uniref:PH domain-containing protein n=1 Tax=Streptomyces sp. NPDC001941 TaxID=3154659 RepID=UPI00332310D9
MDHRPKAVPVAFSSPGQTAVLVIFGMFTALLGVICLADPGSGPFGKVLFSLTIAVGLFFVFRGVRWGVRVSSQGITERAMGRTRTHAWCDIRRVELGRSSGAVTVSVARLEFTDGREASLDGSAEYGTAAARQKIVALQYHHVQHIRSCTACTAREAETDVSTQA